MAPTFWGCCNEDPCMNNSTCSTGKLEPAFWDATRPDLLAYFHDLNVALSSVVPTSTASATASSTPTPTPPPNSSKVSGAVIGGAVGGSLAFALIVAAIVFALCRRKRRNRNQTTHNNEEPNTSTPQKQEMASPMSAGLSRTSPRNHLDNV